MLYAYSKSQIIQDVPGSDTEGDDDVPDLDSQDGSSDDDAPPPLRPAAGSAAGGAAAGSRAQAPDSDGESFERARMAGAAVASSSR